jgi:cellobiose-specific phosphotransferase system component IIC
MIPVLIIGAFSLIFKTFPLSVYQRFIADFAGGFLLRLFDYVYQATFGVLSVYLTFSISRSYMHLKQTSTIVNVGAILTSIMSFFILAGAYLPSFGTEYMGPKSMFLAIVTALGALELSRKVQSKNTQRVESAGITIRFERVERSGTKENRIVGGAQAAARIASSR